MTLGTAAADHISCSRGRPCRALVAKKCTYHTHPRTVLSSLLARAKNSEKVPWLKLYHFDHAPAHFLSQWPCVNFSTHHSLTCKRQKLRQKIRLRAVVNILFSRIISGMCFKHTNKTNKAVFKLATVI